MLADEGSLQSSGRILRATGRDTSKIRARFAGESRLHQTRRGEVSIGKLQILQIVPVIPPRDSISYAKNNSLL